MLLWVDDSNVDSYDSVTKNTAANFNNDLQSLLKLIILKTLLWPRKKESEAHQNTSGPGWVPQYPTVLYQTHDEILATIIFQISYV